MTIRCQQKCDKGSQCTRIADHNDGYHLTEHGCVCLSEDPREIRVFYKDIELIPCEPEVYALGVPPAHPGTVAGTSESSQEHSDAEKPKGGEGL